MKEARYQCFRPAGRCDIELAVAMKEDFHAITDTVETGDMSGESDSRARWSTGIESAMESRMSSVGSNDESFAIRAIWRSHASIDIDRRRRLVEEPRIESIATHYQAKPFGKVRVSGRAADDEPQAADARCV